MVASLHKPPRESDTRKIDPKSISSFQLRSLSDFVTGNSLHLFDSLRIDTIFLEKSPRTWPNCPEYIAAKLRIMNLKIISDCAERAAILVSDFNYSLTYNEEQRQLVLQIVECHRQHVTEPLKRATETDDSS